MLKAPLIPITSPNSIKGLSIFRITLTEGGLQKNFKDECIFHRADVQPCLRVTQTRNGLHRILLRYVFGFFYKIVIQHM